ncbi:MAG: hypothetical protein JWM98_32 [Thermoleophilia bacterium]|nr:hypothetical protein [Thermoleophilia bacterium]
MVTAEDGGGSISHRAFACWLLGAIAVAVTIVGALNWYVDPTGVTSRVTKWRVADNAEVRSEKLDLYEALDAKPEVVLLGSSRAMKLEPAHVRQLTGDRAFNAAVSGGVPGDALLFTKLLQEQQGDRFPHLVWGLDVDAFRTKQLRAGLSTDPRMARFIPRGERLATKLSSLGALTEWQTLHTTIRSVRAGGAKRSAAVADHSDFGPDGFQRWSLPFPRKPVYLGRAVRKEIEQYAGFIFGRDAYTKVEDRPVAEFSEVVRIANRHGDVPTIFVTPYQPIAEHILARHHIADREREVLARLRELQHGDDLHFRVVDLTDLESFGGDPSQFYDGVHMTPVNTRRVLDRLDRDGLLDRAGARLRRAG